jgi:RimJ/RimL family protein N-acetyltransferase
MPIVTLAPLDPAITAAVRGIRVAEQQVVFSRQPADILDKPEAGATPYAIMLDGAPVGMLRIDTGFHLNHDFAAPDTPGVRSFIVGTGVQGRGIGSAASAALPALARRLYPAATAFYLTVNLRNAPAQRAYLRGGFRDTDAHYLLGDAGPQHIFRMDLPAAGTPPKLAASAGFR